MLKINEKFISINGEGPHSGMLALFIRFAGCNLQCSYCDTNYAADLKETEYKEESVEEIIQFVESQGITNVVLTGGEPLLQPETEIIKLVKELNAKGYKVDIETNGSLDISKFKDDACIIMDYKLPSSGMEDNMLLDNILNIKNSDVIKFVCASKKDLDKVFELIKRYDLTNRSKIFLSPVFDLIEPREIVEYMIQKRLNNVTLQLQIHKIIWDPQMRGV